MEDVGQWQASDVTADVASVLFALVLAPLVPVGAHQLAEASATASCRTDANRRGLTAAADGPLETLLALDTAPSLELALALARLLTLIQVMVISAALVVVVVAMMMVVMVVVMSAVVALSERPDVSPASVVVVAAV